MGNRYAQTFSGLLLLLFLLFGGLSFAGSVSEDKPFAEELIVLQISDSDPFKQTLVLNVANNLIEAYGPDKVDIEVVAFGPGLRLLFAENANKGRVDNLAASGVRFAGCMNTVRGMTKQLGHEPALNPNTVRVSAGVVRILELVKADYTLIKP